MKKEGFNNPSSISVNPHDGSVWIADTGNKQVVKLSSGGAELVRVGGFSSPVAVSAIYEKYDINCEDSDGGKSYFTKGNTAVKGGGYYEDYCLDYYNLVEYFCLNNQKAEKTFSCWGHCENGICYGETGGF